MDCLCWLSQWSYQKLWWVANVVGLVAWKLFLFRDESTHHGIKVCPLKFSCCFSIHLVHLILSHTNSLSQTLQVTQMTAVDAQVVFRACVTTLKSIRSENEFNLFWNKVKEFSEKHKIDEPHFSQKEKKKSPIVIWLVKLQVNTQRRFRKNIKDNITLVLIA